MKSSTELLEQDLEVARGKFDRPVAVMRPKGEVADASKGFRGMYRDFVLAGDLLEKELEAARGK